ncbi:MAG TPA: hypothetical protein VFX26_01000 [Nitrososphaeraceae archaeon]|nr:hypothetical protein [Nitrososphaeraceae archaeon]
MYKHSIRHPTKLNEKTVNRKRGYGRKLIMIRPHYYLLIKTTVLKLANATS